MQSDLINMNFVYYFHDEPSIEEFEKKLLRFKAHYNLISCQDLLDFLSGKKQLSNSCLLTIDDGWRSTYEVIFPIIKKYNVPITIFVSPMILREETNFWYYKLGKCNAEELIISLVNKGYFSKKVMNYPLDLILKQLNIDTINEEINENINKYGALQEERGFMNENELIEMSKSGLVEIGAHTLTHPILANESKERSSFEIKESITQLSSMLGMPVRTFAYPNGLYGLDFGKREIQSLRECGIQLAFTVDSYFVSPNTNPLLIPRCGSEKRLKIGKVGVCLPSLSNQVGKRRKIAKLKL